MDLKLENRNNLIINPDMSSLVLCDDCLLGYVLSEDHQLYRAGASSKCDCCEATKEKN